MLGTYFFKVTGGGWALVIAGVEVGRVGRRASATAWYQAVVAGAAAAAAAAVALERDRQGLPGTQRAIERALGRAL